ncbi:MAG: polysaccharide deacetylase family protein [Acidimicrobiales bacterium]
MSHRRRWVVAAAVALTAAGCSTGTEPAPSPPAPPPSTTLPLTAMSTTTAAPMPATPISTEPAAAVSRGDPDRRTVALTFDAGADVGFASDILDQLDASDVVATFGITGRWAEQNPDLVRRMATDGHQIMNHTWSHRSFTGISARPAVLSEADRRDEIERTDQLVQSLTGRSTRPWFRPPYGDYDASVNAAVGALGYRYNVLWSVDSLGWQGLTPPAIVARCLDGAAPGAILLFHVGAQSRDAAALPAIVTSLRQAGYGFGTVAEVVGV